MREGAIPESTSKPVKKVRIATSIDAEIYKKLWEIASRRFPKPGRKVYIIIEEALKEYIQKHYPGG